MGYEVYDRKVSRRRTHTPMISILKQGRLGLNAATTEIFIRLGVTTVLLMLDREARRVALKPTRETTDPRAYTIAFDTANSSRGGGINAGAFLKHAHIGFAESTAFLATWDEATQLLEIELPASAFTNA